MSWLRYEPLNLKKMSQEERNEKAPTRSDTSRYDTSDRNDTSDIFKAVRDEISGSGADIGYRRIHKALK